MRALLQSTLLLLLLACTKAQLAIEAAPNRKPTVEGIAHFTLSGAEPTELTAVADAVTDMKSVETVRLVPEEERFEITLKGVVRRVAIEEVVAGLMGRDDRWTLGWR